MYIGRFHITVKRKIVHHPSGLVVYSPRKVYQRKNTVVSYGAQLFLTNFFQNVGTVPGTFYIGLTNSNYTFISTLIDISADEPTIGVGGYARQPVMRAGSGWTVTQINNQWVARSNTVTFTATAAWSGPYIRAFLCDSATSTGNLIAVSAALPTPVTVAAGQGPSVAYEADLRG